MVRKSPDLNCLKFEECGNRVPFTAPTQYCPPCRKKIPQAKILAQQAEKKSQIEWARKLKAAQETTKIVCGLCSLKLEKNQVCPKCHPCAIKNGAGGEYVLWDKNAKKGEPTM